MRRLMPEAGEALIEGYVVSETTARRLLQDMAHQALELFLTDAKGTRARGAIVFDQFAGDTGHLVLKQPKRGPVSCPVFGVGDAVSLYWSYGGARYRANGRVLRVDGQERAYEVGLESSIYRAQQRAERRVSIPSENPVVAQLYVETPGELLDAKVKNLSMSGCRLAVDAQRMCYTEPEPHHRAFINLPLPPRDQIISNEVRIVWAARVSANTMHISVAWVAPIEKFLANVKRYLVDKSSEA